MSTISVPFTTKNAPITAASTTASFTSASLPHGLQITDDDKGPAVNLAVWISLVTMCIVVIAKVFSKLLKAQDGIQAKNLQSDDFLVLAASIFALGEAIAVSRQVPGGIGQHSLRTPADNLDSFQRAVYASQFLYIGAVAIAKAAASSFLLDLSKDLVHRRTVSGIIFVIIIWNIVAWIGIAAQCSVSERWDILSEKCFDQPFFWAGIEAIHILIDLALIVLPTVIVLKLQTSWNQKSVVLVAFTIRIMIIPLVVVRLTYIGQAYHATDRLYAEWRVAVVTQLTMNIGIIVTCVPFLKSVINHLQPGWSTSNVRVGLGFKSIANSETHPHSGFALGSVVRANHRSDNHQPNDRV